MFIHHLCIFARFHELEAKHGKLEPLVDIKLCKVSTAAVEVGIEDERTCIKHLNLEWTLQKLKEYFNKEFEIPPERRFRIFLFKYECQGPEQMWYNTRSLHRYHVEEGDRMMIQFID